MFSYFSFQSELQHSISPHSIIKLTMASRFAHVAKRFASTNVAASSNPWLAERVVTKEHAGRMCPIFSQSLFPTFSGSFSEHVRHFNRNHSTRHTLSITRIQSGPCWRYSNCCPGRILLFDGRFIIAKPHPSDTLFNYSANHSQLSPGY